MRCEARRGVCWGRIAWAGVAGALGAMAGGCATNHRPDPADAVAAVLDDFHDAAAKGDEDRYFAHFHRDGVFLGTDATERWTAGEFRAWAEPYFERNSAWVYRAMKRNVSIAPDGRSAWFDESLWNEKMGECRGTGVLLREDGRWRVAQYNLTVPVPNEIMGEVAARIREHAAKADGPAKP